MTNLKWKKDADRDGTYRSTDGNWMIEVIRAKNNVATNYTRDEWTLFDITRGEDRKEWCETYCRLSDAKWDADGMAIATGTDETAHTPRHNHKQTL